MTNKGKIVTFQRTGKFYAKMGLKLLSEQRLVESAKYFEKAIKVEPENSEYQFNLSGVLAEMGKIKESINILEHTTHNLKTVMPECYFALGCNYFDAGNFKKSKQCFEKYCELVVAGSLVVEALEAIKFIDNNILNNTDANKNSKIEKLIDKGKKLLDKFEFPKAIAIFEKVINLDPTATIPRNNLSLAYYLQGNVGSAISASREVLRLDSQNSYANSNLALFYKTIDSEDMYKRQLGAIKNSRFQTIEQILNTVDILAKLSEDVSITNLLEKLVGTYDEAILWHLLAISYHNNFRFNKAIDTWNQIKSKLPHMSIFTDCFVMESSKYLKRSISFSSINYDVKVYADYVERIEELIKVMLDMKQEEFRNLWESNDYISDIVNYYLYRLDNKKKLNLIEKLEKTADFGDEKSIHILDAYAANSERKDEISSKCEEIVMRSKVAGDSNINIIELSVRQRECKKRQ
jgi:tetratricopeptide (TPR) repeat protein